MTRSISLYLLSLVLLAGTAHANEGDSLWSRTYGYLGDDFASWIISSSDGGFLLTGWTSAIGAGGQDLWLVKVDSQGDSLWSRTYGGPSEDKAYSIIPSGDGGFLLAGWTLSFGAGDWDMWLLKVNAQGDSLWSKTYGGPSGDGASMIVPSGDGGFLLAGWTQSFGAGDCDMWLVKVDAQGDSLWSRTYGGIYDDVTVAAIPSGDSNFLVAGWTGSVGAGADDMWLVKVNAQGDSLWSRTYGGTSFEYAYSIISSGDGGFLLAGRTQSFGAGSDDTWLVRANSQGDSLWSRTYGGFYSDGANTMTSSGDGGFLLAGWTFSFSEGIYDLWLVKADSLGDSLWANSYGGSGYETAAAITPSGDGDFLLAGGTTSYGAGQRDMWLVCVEGSIQPVEPSGPQLQPLSFVLHDPHPNPFNPTTILTFDLPVASLVKLEVFDINGRLVGAHCVRPSGSGATPTMYPAGTHQIPFDGSGLPSGIYLARLTAGDFQQTQKLILLK